MKTIETQTWPEQTYAPNGSSYPVAPESPEDAPYDFSPVPGWKRMLDLIAIVLTAPLWLTAMVCISMWIRMISPGPIFFLQERVGLHGRRFMMVKFRSMEVHAETDRHEDHFARLVESDRPMTKLDAAGDGRVIFSGAILRQTGLDELPQIFNVLRGEMSLVGPRPCTVRELPQFQVSQRERFNACPGLTGYWQVNGKNKTTFSKMIELDIFYARNMSLRLDLEIMLKTLPALLAQVRESQTVR